MALNASGHLLAPFGASAGSGHAFKGGFKTVVLSQFPRTRGNLRRQEGLDRRQARLESLGPASLTPPPAGAREPGLRVALGRRRRQGSCVSNAASGGRPGA